MKWGLALSGGGFRASLFHLGVLAQLAERDLLRRIEVISTVSGGSIVGALYYLHVRDLLQRKYDRSMAEDKPAAECIQHEDYVTLVRGMAEAFLAAVRTNIRMRTFVNPLRNLRMASRRYSRSDRIAELYDELIYQRAPSVDPAARPQMRHLLIAPKGRDTSFSPWLENGGREDKVPILLVNATALNSGHNWRFEARTMGEPPARAPIHPHPWTSEIDLNMKLERPPSYDAIVARQQDVTLGHAVAASAAVPALFAPLALSGMYAQRLRVELVDGGVHDNQGVAALIDTECGVFIVSDASGQLGDETNPGTGTFGVIMRTNDILMDRVREEQLFRLMEQIPAGDIAYLSLRQGLRPRQYHFLRSKAGSRLPATPLAAAAGRRFETRTHGRIQDSLSRIRTDLDSFTDMEAYALMANGYALAGAECQARKTFRAASGRIIQQGSLSQDSRFRRAQEWCASGNGELLRHLQVGRHKLFKVFRLVPALGGLAVLAIAAVAGALLWYTREWWWEWFWAPAWIPLAAIALMIAGGLLPKLGRAVKAIRFLTGPADGVRRLALEAVLPALAAGLVWLHLNTVDRLFLSLGRIPK